MIRRTRTPGGVFEPVLADSGFCDYQRLQEMEVEREESFYVPDKRHEVDRSGEGVRGEYDKSKFELDAESLGMICPAGHAMKMISETSFKDGYVERLFEGTVCDECPVRASARRRRKGVVRFFMTVVKSSGLVCGNG